jgi:hypothetical protein
VKKMDAKRGAVGFALLLGISLTAGCTRGPSSADSDPMTLTEKITRAVYANDMESATVDFDDSAKKDVTRASVGTLSDAMHRLGAIKSVTQRSSDPDSGRYEYDVAFERGSLIAHLRLDPSGKVGAYHVDGLNART